MISLSKIAEICNAIIEETKNVDERIRLSEREIAIVYFAYNLLIKKLQEIEKYDYKNN